MQRTAREMAYNRVEFVLRNETEIRRTVNERRAELSANGHSGGGSTGHAFVSDPTAIQAIKAVEPLKAVTLNSGYTVHSPEKWLDIVTLMYSHYPQADMMRYFYAGHNAIQTGEKFHFSERQVYYLRDDFRQMGVEIACQYGLTRVIDI